jgi:flagellar hook protein FlgE
MLASIYIGMTGLTGYSAGLRVIANNTANLNTPGYKGSSLQFSDLFYGNATLTPGANNGPGQLGFGLNTNGTVLNFQQGELRQTGNDLDLAVTGQGLFVLKDGNGGVHYTRAGQFEFNTDGKLVDRVTGYSVMALDANNALTEVSIANAGVGTAKPTSTIKFQGNLPSSVASQSVSGLTVFDAAGGQHTLSAQLTSTNGSPAGGWTVALLDGATTVGSGVIQFSNGSPVPGSATVALTYTPPGQAAVPLVLDFSTGVTSFASGNLSTLEMSSQDGFGPSGLTQTTFDATGTLLLTYANAQVVKGPRLALARFDSADAVQAEGMNQFEATDSRAWHTGVAGSGAFGTISAKMIEISNVDLSQEFSDLVIMQRGYQASSQIVSTANDMLQELFSMKGK